MLFVLLPISFLQNLNHKHIVKLHGVTAGSVETNVASGKECGFFIVVDRLVDTLEERLERWRDENEAQRENGGALRLLQRSSSTDKQRKRAELLERIQIAYAIADAMEYLHDTVGIVFRDLKPDNIGFDSKGTLKLFDFGLAKELKPGMEKVDGRYQLTGNTGRYVLLLARVHEVLAVRHVLVSHGCCRSNITLTARSVSKTALDSRRYMAPEVAKESPYNNSVDVYSFGILLWELCSGDKPFYGYSSGKHMQQVVIGGERPPMTWQYTAHWPANLQWLMHRCWSPFPVIRPTFAVIKQTLQDILDGKETVPEMSSPVPNPAERNSVASPPSVLSNLFLPLTRRSTRSKTVGSAAAAAGDVGEAAAVATEEGPVLPKSPLPKAGRHRSLSFGLKR
jgi:serine/threonine protein kinase